MITAADNEQDVGYQIEQALYDLGDTAQQVMETLLNKGINLDRCCPPFTLDTLAENPDEYCNEHSADNCPVHDYLAQQFPELTLLTVGQCVTMAAQGRVLTKDGSLGNETFIKNPPAVGMFITYYDGHCLDVLEDA